VLQLHCGKGTGSYTAQDLPVGWLGAEHTNTACRCLRMHIKAQVSSHVGRCEQALQTSKQAMLMHMLCEDNHRVLWYC
jgi:hypothetical protein